MFAWEMVGVWRGWGGDTVCWRVWVWCFIQSSLDEMEVLDHASPRCWEILDTTCWHILNIYGVERNMQILNANIQDSGNLAKYWACMSLLLSFIFLSSSTQTTRSYLYKLSLFVISNYPSLILIGASILRSFIREIFIKSIITMDVLFLMSLNI